ncbi:ABC transporter ATP-binding protein [Propionivibrio soli]|uniref:ABC transporter ATP-binding protein n=1 Tax=Propionivibrio soli TaxID=2976531 RepID=UPI0021E7066B|nr:ABC transporter ATP-binding protein [Propionivibrio soli]
MANIEIRNVSKGYGGRAVLSNLSLELNDGECFTLLGPSGCGKTVLTRLIAGFEAPDAGTILIGGNIVADAATGDSLPTDKRGLGMVFQDYAVWPHMTVFDNIAYPLKIAGIDAEALKRRTLESIEMVGLKNLEERLPSQLSGGQQQRVALARALVHEPGILLLDEPLNNLDANLREEMRFEIKALQQKLGVTILYVTHDQEIALGIADRIAIMDADGRIRQIGTPEEVYEKSVDDYVFRFLGIANLLPVRRRNDDLFLGDTGEAWTGETPATTGDRFTAGFRPSDVILAREGEGLPGIIRRASFLGAQIDYLIDIAGTLIRATLPSHEGVARDLMFVENDPCRIHLASVQWFPGDIVVTNRV